MGDPVSDPTETVLDGAHAHASEPGAAKLDARARRGLRRLLTAAALTLIALVVAGVVVERSAQTPLIQIGQVAPDFALPSTDGNVQSLAAVRGRPVVLAFVPSVQCDRCRAQLQAIQAALPALRARGAVIFVVSTDTAAVQRAVAGRLGLDYPILSEAPTVNQHPVGSAYGVYHLSQQQPGPVDANALVAIDRTGIIRAVHVAPYDVVPAAQIPALVDTTIGSNGGS